MTYTQLTQQIHFQTIDAPCCFNCKWFMREWEDAICKHPQNIWKYSEPELSKFDNELYCKEYNVCDRFERKIRRTEDEIDGR